MNDNKKVINMNDTKIRFSIIEIGDAYIKAARKAMETNNPDDQELARILKSVSQMDEEYDYLYQVDKRGIFTLPREHKISKFITSNVTFSDDELGFALVRSCYEKNDPMFKFFSSSIHELKQIRSSDEEQSEKLEYFYHKIRKKEDAFLYMKEYIPDFGRYLEAKQREKQFNITYSNENQMKDYQYQKTKGA